VKTSDADRCDNIIFAAAVVIRSHHRRVLLRDILDAVAACAADDENDAVINRAAYELMKRYLPDATAANDPGAKYALSPSGKEERAVARKRLRYERRRQQLLDATKARQGRDVGEMSP
jgi:hypothetical protein